MDAVRTAIRAVFQRQWYDTTACISPIDIIREPSYGEDLQVTTSIFEINSLFGHRNTCICDVQGQLCYISWSMGAFVNRQTGRLQKVPENNLSR